MKKVATRFQYAYIIQEKPDDALSAWICYSTTRKVPTVEKLFPKFHVEPLDGFVVSWMCRLGKHAIWKYDKEEYMKMYQLIDKHCSTVKDDRGMTIDDKVDATTYKHQREASGSM